MSEAPAPRIVWFDAPGPHALETVGGKCRNLARLTSLGLPVPPGFTVTTGGYREHVRDNGLATKIAAALADASASDDHAQERIATAFAEVAIAPDLAREIVVAYHALCARNGHAAVAVRSSATSEDLAEASFAGLQATFLDVAGDEAVVERVRACWASLYTAHAIAYRRAHGPAMPPAMAVAVQALVPARSAGVMFTLDPIDGDRSRMVIEAAYGLGETLVGGEVDPDRFVLERASGHVIERRIGRKTVALIHNAAGPERISVPPARQALPCLSDDDLGRLHALGHRVEAALGPDQDIEWAIDGTGACYLLQARPVTTRPVAAAAAPAERSTLPPLYQTILRSFGAGATTDKNTKQGGRST